jgi:hypothetical protein
MSEFCTACGQALGATDAFCPRCGKALSARTTALAGQAQSASATVERPFHGGRSAIAWPATAPPAPTWQAPLAGQAIKTGGNTALIFVILAIAAIVISAAVDTFYYVWLVANLNISLSYTANKVLMAIPLGADVVAVLFIVIALAMRRSTAERGGR